MRPRTSDSTRTSACTPAASHAHQLAEQQRLVAAAVLEVDQQPVEPGQPERLGGERAAERQERAEQRLARGQAGLHRRHRARRSLGVPLMRPRRARRTMARMKLTIPFLAACAAALLVPAAAQAGTLSYEGDTLVYRASPACATRRSSARPRTAS